METYSKQEALTLIRETVKNKTFRERIEFLLC